MRAKNNTKSPSDSSWAISGANWGDYALQKSVEKSLQKTTQKNNIKSPSHGSWVVLGAKIAPTTTATIYYYCKVAPSWLQYGSKMAEAGPKMLQDNLKMVQNGPKLAAR